MQPSRVMPVTDRRRESTALSVETVLPSVVALLIAVPSPISVNLTLGGLIALVLAPVTFPGLWRNTRGRWLIIVILALIPTGWIVAQSSLLQDNGRTFSTQVFFYHAALPVGLLAGLAGSYWCITKLALHRFLLFSFISVLAAELVTLNPENPWKYGLSVPVSMLGILLFAKSRLMLGLVVVPVLAAVSIVADLRSGTAIVLTTAVLVIFARRRSTQPSAAGLTSRGLVAAVVAVVVGGLVVQAASAGLLGNYLEQRTNDQLRVAGGNLVLGGRPEWGAAFALLSKNPLGIGTGVTPSADDYRLAIRNMPLGSRGLQEMSTVADSLRQGQVNFHSGLWTLWGLYGFAGIVLSALALIFFAAAVMKMTAGKFRQPRVPAAVLFFMLTAMWDTLFTPPVVAQFGIALATALHVLGDPNVASDAKDDYSP
jgi:hypothetical protein